MGSYVIKFSEIEKAHLKFEPNEPRDLFYRAATELVRLAVDNQTSLSVTEALAVLLQTWNRAHYRYRKFDMEHFNKIDSLIRRHAEVLASYRRRAIENLVDSAAFPTATLADAAITHRGCRHPNEHH